MLDLPNFEDMYQYENGYMLTTKPNRIGKILVQFELLKKTANIPGDIVEFGVFKGSSFIRLALFRNLLGMENAKKLIGFDIFGIFPNAITEKDKVQKQDFIQLAGDESITTKQLEKVLANNSCKKNIDLIAGDICQSLPEYLEHNLATKFSFINLDVDLEHVTSLILEYCYSRLSRGGIIMFDDYAFFEGATAVIDNFCKINDLKLQTSTFSKSPAYIIKG